MATDVSVGATRSTTANTLRIGSEPPTSSPKRDDSSPRRYAFSASRRPLARRACAQLERALDLEPHHLGRERLMRKSKAPSFIASTAVSTVPKAVMIIAGQSGSSSRTPRSTSTPSSPSILRSVMTKSARRLLEALEALLCRSWRRAARWPIFLTTCASPSRMVSLSSMIRIVATTIASGRASVKVVPRPGALSTARRAPWSRAMSRTKARPRPVPLCLVV